MQGNEERIEQLISQASDPIIRATLIVLSRMDSALIENTRATRSIADNFTAHRAQFDEFVNEERKLIATVNGGMKTATWFIGVVQILCVALFGLYTQTHTKTNDAQDAKLSQLEREISAEAARLAAIEALLTARRVIEGAGNGNGNGK